MLYVPSVRGGFAANNLTAGSRSGTTVTASATPHTKGSWVSLIDPTAAPSWGIYLRGRNVGVNNVRTSLLLDLGYGPTGGGNEQVLLPNLNFGAASGANTIPAGKYFYFPIYIPSGVRVSARCQAAVVSDTVDLAVWLETGQPYQQIGGAVEDYGTDLTNSYGTSVTPGSSAFGSWVELLQNDGTTSGTKRPHRFWATGYDLLADQTVAAAILLVELGIGPDGGNVSTIMQTQWGQAGGEEIVGPTGPKLVYQPVPAGTKLWARIASGETEARGVTAYGVD
jgi:hypothetical protein